jgi:excisionase family DNA binding protein
MSSSTDSPRNNECLINISDVAELTSLSTRTIARLTAAGRIPGSMKLGGARRYHRQKVLDWLDRGTSNQQKKGQRE